MTPIPLSLAPLPVFSNWSNPIPETFNQLDGRNHILANANNRFLEMHPKGVRTVINTTEYCILTIMILNFSSPVNIPRWDTKNKQEVVFADQEPIHLIRSNATGKFLCMNNRSVIYQSDINTTDCHFRQEIEKQEKSKIYSVRYYRNGVTRNKTRKWYIEFNKDNSVRCGNSTSAKHKGANFYRRSVDTVSLTSPPFEGLKNKECCLKKKCKKGPGRKRPTPEPSPDEKVRRKKCKKLVKFCKKSRRNFFKLPLKKLRRYYKRCIQNRKEVRRCKRHR